MNNDKIKMLERGLTTAFIDNGNASNLAYKPQFVSNNYKEGRKVISSIEDELFVCDEFFISVAFITMGGLTPLLQTLKELEQRGIQGRILTTDYLCFSEPRAIQTLASLKNIKIKMYITDGQDEGFHTKGYIFKKEEFYRIIVGSSNMTMKALTTNREWNTKLISTYKGEYLRDILIEFEELWNSENALEYEQFIEVYSKLYIEKKIIRRQKEIVRNSSIPSFEAYKLQPNSMQVGFIANLKKISESGEKRALLISATGTGKTYASAFAMREMGFKRVLFLVHRNQIAKQAEKSFQRVFGNTITTGMVTGESRDFESDYIFATIQTFSKTEILHRFASDYFDACIYDEAHHICTDSYQRVMNYLNPKFILGMTATPDKRDDNIKSKNVYEIFGYNIAYEIRLQQAMEENLLCPFHYFGITDIIMNLDKDIKKKEKRDIFRYLTSDERVNYVIEQADYYGYSGKRVKGLIFCSRIDEARELSQKFNEKGFRTIALSGNDSEKIREEAIERLVMDVPDDIMRSRRGGIKNSLKDYDYLDYIITVDIFSEGADIVEWYYVKKKYKLNVDFLPNQ